MRSITAPAPLRSTTEWAGYREARPIPWRWGACGGEALQYDDTRTRFVWCDRASLSVDSVRVGGQLASGWTWRNGVDSTGATVTFIEFSAAVPEGQSVIARGRAALHPERGNLMESPAEVLWDLLANLGRLTLPEARFAVFAQQCAAVDLVVGGTVDRADPLYQLARGVGDSIGAVFSLDMVGLARLWPGPAPAAVATVERRAGVGVTSTASLADLCEVLTIRYAWEADEPRGAVQYRVRGAAGGDSLARTLDARWISSTRVAALVCERLLRHRSRPVWEVSASGLAGEIRIGQAVALDHPLIPVTGEHLVLAREFDNADGIERSAITVRAPYGAEPVLELVHNTNASDPLAQVVATTTATGDEIEVLIQDDQQQPMPGAECVLDGTTTRFADSAGIVRYPRYLATPGMHTIVATAPGRNPVTLTFEVR